MTSSPLHMWSASVPVPDYLWRVLLHDSLRTSTGQTSSCPSVLNKVSIPDCLSAVLRPVRPCSSCCSSSSRIIETRFTLLMLPLHSDISWTCIVHKHITHAPLQSPFMQELHVYTFKVCLRKKTTCKFGVYESAGLRRKGYITHVALFKRSAGVCRWGGVQLEGFPFRCVLKVPILCCEFEREGERFNSVLKTDFIWAVMTEMDKKWNYLAFAGIKRNQIRH